MHIKLYSLDQAILSSFATRNGLIGAKGKCLMPLLTNSFNLGCLWMGQWIRRVLLDYQNL